jgi:F0F1-type ATP synthase assembly protein I
VTFCTIRRESALAKQDEDVNWGKLAGIGLQVAVGVVVGLVVGRWLDNRYGWTPRGTIIGMMLGLAGGLYLLIREGIRINK